MTRRFGIWSSHEEEYRNVLTFRTDVAWRAADMQLVISITPNVTQPLVRSYLRRAPIDRKEKNSCTTAGRISVTINTTHCSTVWLILLCVKFCWSGLKSNAIWSFEAQTEIPHIKIDWIRQFFFKEGNILFYLAKFLFVSTIRVFLLLPC
jgi:hypothetical protein